MKKVIDKFLIDNGFTITGKFEDEIDIEYKTPDKKYNIFVTARHIWIDIDHSPLCSIMPLGNYQLLSTNKYIKFYFRKGKIEKFI